jgi:hypothetical protein
MNFNWRRRYRPPIIPDVGRAEFYIESKKAAGWAGRWDLRTTANLRGNADEGLPVRLKLEGGVPRNPDRDGLDKS